MAILGINSAVKQLLNVFDNVNTHISYGGNVFVSDDDAEADAWDEQKHIARHCVIFRKLGDKYCAELNGWYAHTICLTGLSFDDPLVFKQLKSKTQISMPANIKDGVGERFLYKALGERTLTVAMDLNFNGQNESFDTGEVRATSYINSVSINFENETDAELDKIYQKVEAQQQRVNNHLLLAQTSGSYTSFHKLTGLID